jgi:FAD/FMN-containing dehydrogenase
VERRIDVVRGPTMPAIQKPLTSRRQFAALAVSGLLSACGDSKDGSSVKPGSTWTALDQKLTGVLLRPGDQGYATAAKPYNAALGVRRPAAIARVAGRRDVTACVREAAARALPIAARSGGHSYAGYSTPNGGLVVDVSALRSITVKADGTAVVGAGARLIDVYAALAAQGRALPAGSCPTVGTAGSTLGGGIGVLSRAYGLTCDHLRAATVVTADGAVQAVNGNHDADLFWALRGGGGGNGGIVTDFTFATVPLKRLSTFSMQFPDAVTAEVLQAWSAWISAAPDQLSSNCHVSAAPVPGNHLAGTWTGPSAALDAHLDALVAAVGTAPLARTSYEIGFLDAMRDFADCAAISITACHPTSVRGGRLGRESFRAASRLLDHPLDATTAERVVELVSGPSDLVLLFDALGGQVAQPAPGDTAFVHRTALASVQVYSPSATGGPAVNTVQQALSELIGTGGYVNYLNPDQKDWAVAYYGSNRKRLRQVIGKYDPDGVFGFAQSALRA